MPKTATEIIDLMMSEDLYSQWLGIKRIKESPGNVILEMEVTDEMVNGFKIAHGGITYGLSDSALAFASNSHGRKAVSVETSIAHVKKVFVGDILRAEAKEISRSYKIGHYGIKVYNQEQTLVSFFRGTVYFSSDNW